VDPVLPGTIVAGSSQGVAAKAYDLSGPMTQEAGGGCVIRAVAFDFEKKVERAVELGELRELMALGLFVWVDLDIGDAEQARGLLAELNLFSDEIVEDALSREPATQSARYDGYLHFVISGCRLIGRHFDLERVDCVIGERFLFTLHKGQVVFLEALKKDYSQDFVAFARSPSFLIYEIWDHLTDNYLAVQKRFEERVEQLQTELMRDVDDKVFASVSELGPTCSTSARWFCPLARCSPICRPAARSTSARPRSRSWPTWLERWSGCCKTCWWIATCCRTRSICTCRWCSTGPTR
jgi:Mg2+ and Co2+ transporter CorA